MRSPRAGFTLIEIMVAMALTVFLLVIMSQAFVMSLDTFSGMKGIGDMQINLRTAEMMLRDDLSMDHFTGKRRLSDLDANGQPLIVSQPAIDGYFAVRRGSTLTNASGAPYFSEGSDTFGLPSARAVDHMIYMTCKRKGNRQENFYNTALQVPAGSASTLDTFFNNQTAYNTAPTDLANSTWAPPYAVGSGLTTGFYGSQWVEVLYYLVRTGSTSSPNDPTSLLGTPTYSLYRAQWVMVPDGTNLAGKLANGLEASTFAGMSCNPGGGGLAFYSPADVALGNRVIKDLAPTAFDPAVNGGRLLRLDSTGVTIRETLVLPNVLSFQVQVMELTASGVAGSFQDVRPTAVGGAPQAWGVYDTTKFSGAPANGYQAYGIKGIQVTLRVWDNKTSQTRQTTIVQDL